jgi:hypothetical protein
MTAHVPRLPFSLDLLIAEAKRRMRRRRLLIAVVAIVLLLGGGAVGTIVAVGSPNDLTPPSKAIDIAAIEKSWQSQLLLGARVDPRKHFSNPSKTVLLRRVRLAASRYHFTVVKVQVLHPRQAAPLVVVETADEQALSAATPAILRLIDPKARTNDDRTGWAYEGFLFEARNTKGVPFLATFNWLRNPQSAGGGQAASSERLYPFDHG